MGQFYLIAESACAPLRSTCSKMLEIVIKVIAAAAHFKIEMEKFLMLDAVCPAAALLFSINHPKRFRGEQRLTKGDAPVTPNTLSSGPSRLRFLL